MLLVADGRFDDAARPPPDRLVRIAPVTEFGPIERTAAGFRAGAEAGPIEVSAFAPGVFRLTLGEVSGPDFGILVAKPEPPPGIDVGVKDDDVGLTVGDLHLVLRRGPLRLALSRG